VWVAFEASLVMIISPAYVGSGAIANLISKSFFIVQLQLHLQLLETAVQEQYRLAFC
jgi:hypothetical protein